MSEHTLIVKVPNNFKTNYEWNYIRKYCSDTLAESLKHTAGDWYYIIDSKRMNKITKNQTIENKKEISVDECFELFKKNNNK
tara:strand:- start:165 stop:410 length:246 start_codon:yes stop_codon:yes gene_type:complete